MVSSKSLLSIYNFKLWPSIAVLGVVTVSKFVVQLSYVLHFVAGIKQAYRMQSFTQYMSAAGSSAGRQRQTICDGCGIIVRSREPVTAQNCRA